MTDPCLPYFWNKGYPAMPGLIAMGSVFLVVSVEMFFASRGAGHSHSTEWGELPPDGRRDVLRKKEMRQSGSPSRPANGHIAMQKYIDSPGNVEDGFLQAAKKHTDDEDGDDASDTDDLDMLDPLADESAHLNHPKSHKRQSSHDDDGHTDTQNPQKLFLQCLLLEAGILFHSIFIGMAVSVATGTEFIVLLIAICFHQTFEGFALGSRIAALIPALFDSTSPKPWLMALAYGCTTPIGQAIGLWMHELYDPASMMGLLMVGITNAISSGLLLFAGLVQLIAEDFLSDRSYEVLNGRKRIEACIAVAAGGLLMAIVGAFA
jgi:zinc transporter ZupT